jgi:hypothetical protein
MDFQDAGNLQKSPMNPQRARGKAQGDKTNMFRSRDLRSPSPEREDGRDFWESLSKWLNSYDFINLDDQAGDFLAIMLAMALFFPPSLKIPSR